MRLHTPPTLHYPVQITKLLCRPGETVERNQALFQYVYTSKVLESSPDNPEGIEVARTWPAQFESELEGTLNEITVKVGQILTQRSLVADVEELCRHEIQYGGICANCGIDVTTLAGYNSTIRDTDRATVNTVHGHTALLISDSEASRADEEAKRRLLDTRKLSLVVDLDQTIIQATVDPTVHEWQQDPSNPNHDAVKDVRAFSLGDGVSYYIKLRPGLIDFLDTISQTYELHIYTMGTRAYAENIAKVIDPDRKIFGERILSRDESGSMTAKNLKRLFPVDTKMVVIIDDRGDVWHWSPNLIKVAAYDFFVGIGDINSSFLPKRQELDAKPITAANGVNGVELSAVDRMMSMAGDQGVESMKEKTEEQDSTLASQMTDRPLLQKQKILDAADDEAKASPAAEAALELLSEDNTDSFEHPKYRHNLLQDDDTELLYLKSALQQIHSDFFQEYDRSRQGRRLRDLQAIPDAADIMRALKSKVLAGVNLVFSGVVPLGVDIHAHDTVIWAKNFGAQVSERITKRTTHVVASPERRTAKVRQAARKGARVKIVGVAWLMACFSRWQHVSEERYLIHTDGTDQEEVTEMSLSSSEDELVKYGPQKARDDSSTDGAGALDDWDDELAEFLGSDAEGESDLESVSSKRKRDDTEESEDSRLQKRRKEAPVPQADATDDDGFMAALAAELDGS